MDRPTRDVLTQQLAVAHQVTLEYPTVASAEAAGYHMTTTYVPCIGAHYINNRVPLLLRPERGRRCSSTTAPAPTRRSSGLSYAQLSGQDDRPRASPARTTSGTSTTSTAGSASRPGSWSAPRACRPPSARREAATKIPLDSLWMMHAWVADGWPSAWGIFSAEHPDLGGQDRQHRRHCRSARKDGRV